MQAQEPDFQSSIEPWELTAFALRELEGADLARVSRYVAEHPECLADIEQIQHVAETLRQQLNSSARGMALDAQRAHQVQSNLHSTSLESNPPQTLWWTRGRTVAAALCALAATALIALFVLPNTILETTRLTARSEPEVVSGTKEVYKFERELETAAASVPGESLAESVVEESEPNFEPRPSDGLTSANDARLLDGIHQNAVVDYDDEGRRKSQPSEPSIQPSVVGKDAKEDAERTLQVQSQRTAGGAEKEYARKALPDAAPPIQPATLSSLSSTAAASPSSGNLGGGAYGPSGGPGSAPAGYGGGGMPSAGGGFAAGGLAGGKPATHWNARNRTLPSTGGSAPATLDTGRPALDIAPGVGGRFSSSAGESARADRLEVRLAEHEVDEKQASAPTPEFPEELRQNVPSRRYASPMPTGDRMDVLVEMPFTKVTDAPLSTFSIDVDTASYSKLRQYVLEHNTLPTPGSLRLEELINYFEYDYAGPTDGSPFAAHLRLADCPWNKEHRLVRVALQAKKVDTESRPASNLVFLIDVSGSMAAANKLPLVKRTLTLLASQLRPDDRVAIVVYAGAAGCVLPSTLGSQKEAILASINELQSGGSTNGGQGIELAYKLAKDNYIPEGINRVILCTDGDFNVGVTGTDQLVAMMKENAKSNVFLTCLGYGIGNYNDSMMEKIADQGNGTYAMVDNELEARRIMVEQLSGTLMTVAKDVKIQVEFNPTRVASYRLIGYENRKLAAADFDNDRKDAGEIGAGHRVTALYEIVPVGKEGTIPGNIELRYGATRDAKPADTNEASTPSDKPSAHADEWMLLKIRSKQPEASESTKQEFPLKDGDTQLVGREQADLEWSVCVAEFGLLLRHSPWAPGADWDRLLSRAAECILDDPYRRECYNIMQRSKLMSESRR